MQRRRAARALTLCLAVAASTPVAAQLPSAAISAPVTGLRYDVIFDSANAAKRQVHVVTTFDVAGSGPVLLSLPDWTPGAYEISYFARWVTDFAAAADGRPLEWDKSDFDTWRIRTANATHVTVSFDYRADSLDNAMTWARPDFLLFNGTNLFLYPEGRPLDFSAMVTVHAEPSWLVVTGMRETGAPAAHQYTASNYHDLVDMPFFVGRVELDSARIVNRWVRLATYPVGSMTGAARAQAWDQLKRAIPAEAAVFDTVPWNDYTVMQIADSAYQGASGLEHQSSHVDVVTPMVIGSEFQPSLYAHEIFHSWNVKRLRPTDMWPYVYSRALPTPWLWVSEGITDYYADLALVRGGITDAEGFYALTAEKIKEVNDTRPVALTDASLDSWIHPVDGTEYTYYPKGSLAGLMLDIMIRDASDDAHSLDDVMRELYRTTYERGHGFTSGEWWGAVSRAAGGRSFADFAARYVDGRDPYPWQSVLPLAGLRAVPQNEARLGIATQPEPNGMRVMAVDPGSAAEAAGIAPGDLLLSVGDVRVTDQRFGDLFRAKYGSAAEGTPISIRVQRGDREQTVTATLQFSHGVRIENDPAATPKAVRIRDGILHATTGRP